MKRIVYILFVLIFISCQNKDITTPQWPEWPNPSAPTIVHAALKGANGEIQIPAGGKIRFTADVSDTNNDLVSYQLLIRMDEAEILNITKNISGRSFKIVEEAVLPFVAGFKNGKLNVSLKVSNALANTTTELVLKDEESVDVVRPENPEQLFLIDSKGAVYIMQKLVDSPYGYRTTAADLTSVGADFKIAQRMIDNKPDYSGLVWGWKNNKISVVTEETSTSISTPNSSNFPIQYLEFDMLSFNISKLLQHRIQVDLSSFFAIGGAYTQSDINLVEDAVVSFTGMGSDLAKNLRPEFFKPLGGTDAKFTGPTALYNLKFNSSTKFLYLERPRDVFYPEVMYILGTGAGLPIQPFVATLEWDFSYPHQWLFFKKSGPQLFEATLYLNNSMGFKFFKGYGWAQEVDTKNKYQVIPNTLVTRSGAGDLIPGAQFKAGIYQVKMDVGQEIIEFIPQN